MKDDLIKKISVLLDKMPLDKEHKQSLLTLYGIMDEASLESLLVKMNKTSKELEKELKKEKADILLKRGKK